MRKDEPPSVLGEALLDAVVPRRKPKDYRPRRPAQPANTFVNRSGEIASDMAAAGVSPSSAFALPSPNRSIGSAQAGKASTFALRASADKPASSTGQEGKSAKDKGRGSFLIHEVQLGGGRGESNPENE
ncbi:MAG TPA: hypothetical protein VGC27_05345 [Rhizomicrobium sp.]